ncbi:MFS transporter [Streptomyces sp. W16]|uniref:MFS transporter n=1 Tax=Streptomyces sp. W16 TaxID=3076631 RepID=UPI00295A8EAD|nr:MFS transporter [Streptomyces sp. W16]MDV9170883.1 MFS transporter [Streptomyces sp. W16]
MSSDSSTNRRALWTFAVTSAAGFMAALDNLVVTTALPAIRRHLGGGLADLEWTVNAYTLTFAVLLMSGAALGDRFGRRRLFGIGLGIFTLASLGAALAPDIGSLIAARAVQGAGAAILLPLTLTLLSAAVPANRRGLAFGAWGAVNGLAIALGPLVGGAIVQHLSWQWIFALNVPVGLVLLPLSRFRLTESRGPNDGLDVVGTALASAGLFGIVLGVIRGNSDGWSSPLVLAGLLGGVVLLAAFLLWEARTAHPLLPLRLYRRRAFGAVNAASLLMSAGMFGSIFLLSQFLQIAEGYSPMTVGLRLLPWTGMPMIVAPVAGALSDRISGRTLIAVGLTLQATSLGWLALLLGPHMSYAAQVPPFVLGGTGMALFFAPLANVLMSSVRPEEQGVASGANSAMREVGGALGVAVLTSVFTAHGDYTSARRFADGLVPAVWTGAAAITAAAVAILFVPVRRAPASGGADSSDQRPMLESAP